MATSLVLIGMMGSGKTTVSKAISALSHYEVLDVDLMIEAQESKSISDIFAISGEVAFRNMESTMLKFLLNEQVPRIISTGGGAILDVKNRQILKQLGRVYWLRVSADTVYARLKNDTSRPLLQHDDSLSRISRLIEVRYPLYESIADMVMDVDLLDPEFIAAEIWQDFLVF